jgi:hypothetical protein
MGGDHLGRFEHFLLLAALRLGEEAYGMTIRRELAEHTGRDIAVGAIYTAPRMSPRARRHASIRSLRCAPSRSAGQAMLNAEC